MLKNTFISLVRSNLEFDSLIWSPNLSTYTIELNYIQNKFLKSISYKLNFPFSRDSINQIQETLSLDCLSLRSNLTDIMFAFVILNGHVLYDRFPNSSIRHT